jgi:hypothetical protein
MSLRDSFKFVAGGAVAPSRFVILDATYDSTVTQAGTANIRCIGVSQTGTKEAPGLTGASANAATADKDMLQVFLPGDIAPLEIGSGGVTRGNMIKTDNTGKGVASATTGATLQWVQAIALESGAAGEIINVLVTEPTPYYPALA